MKLLEDISNFQEAFLGTPNNFGFGFSSLLNKELDRDKVVEEIEIIYKDADSDNSQNIPYKFKSPEIIFLKSPMASQLAASYIRFLSRQIHDRWAGWRVYYYRDCKNKEELDWTQFYKYFIKDLESGFAEKIRNMVSYKLWNEVKTATNRAINKYFETHIQYFHSDSSIAARELTIPNSNFKVYEYNNELVDYGIFDIIFLEKFCIVSELPFKIIRASENRLHSKDSAAVEWRDGFGLYYWNGILIPKEWIMNKASISKTTILSETNIERRRCLMEIIGSEKYFELLNIVCIDKQDDEHGNPMKLFRTKELDATINEYIYYLSVIDPSTKREYFISVPPCYDVEWAKAATFGDEKIQYRQGDVGLLNLDMPFEKPLVET